MVRGWGILDSKDTLLGSLVRSVNILYSSQIEWQIDSNSLLGHEKFVIGKVASNSITRYPEDYRISVRLEHSKHFFDLINLNKLRGITLEAESWTIAQSSPWWGSRDWGEDCSVTSYLHLHLTWSGNPIYVWYPLEWLPASSMLNPKALYINSMDSESAELSPSHLPDINIIHNNARPHLQSCPTA